MKCSEAIMKNLCLGCMRVEQEDLSVDNCEYRDNGLRQCKKIIKQMKMEGY